MGLLVGRLLSGTSSSSRLMHLANSCLSLQHPVEWKHGEFEMGVVGVESLPCTSTCFVLNSSLCCAAIIFRILTNRTDCLLATWRLFDCADVSPCACRLVQEYCDCGTLSNVGNRLREAGAADNMLRLVLLLADVANGLKVLHSSNTVHGDLVSHSLACTLCGQCCGSAGQQ